MIDQPATKIILSHANDFLCTGHCQDRVMAIADRFKQHFGMDKLPDCKIAVVQRPEPHTGLGTGTQLAMAVADGLQRFCNTSVSGKVLATQIANRGKRSAVGVHGYFRGGLIFEEFTEDCDLNEIQQQVDLPPAWTVVVASPTHTQPVVSGHDEQSRFDALASSDPDRSSNELREIITTQMIPAIEQEQFEDFADAVQRYNFVSGMLFSSTQGGPYNGKFVSDNVESMKAAGAKGVGQSSWGPSVFAWFDSSPSADDFVRRFDSPAVRLIKTKARTI